jgi:signal transduction histidine kinase/CheY-like chemotaxis protein
MLNKTSLRTRLSIILIIIIILLVFFSAEFFLSAWNKSQENKLFNQHNEIAKELNYVAGIQGEERGIGNSIIGGSQTQLGRFLELRRQVNELEAKILAQLEEVSSLRTTGSFQRGFQIWRQNYEDLKKARIRVEHGEITSEEWLATTSRNIFYEFDLRNLLFSPNSDREAALYYNMVLRPDLTYISEFAGRERALISNILARGASITPEELAEIKRQRSRIDRANRQVAFLKKLDFTPPLLKTTIQDFETNFHGDFEALRQSILKVNEENLKNVRDSKLEMSLVQRDINNHLVGIQNDLFGLVSNDAFQEAVEALQGKEKTPSLRVTNLFEDITNVRKIYSQIRFLDDLGNERIRMDFDNHSSRSTLAKILQNKNDKPYFLEANELQKDELYVSRFDLNMEHGKVERPFNPSLRYATTVIFEGRHYGVAVFNLLAQVILEMLPVDMFLVSADGYYLHYPQAEKQWGMMSELNRTEHNLKRDIPTLAEEILSGNTGQIQMDNATYLYNPIHFHPADKNRFWVLVKRIQATPYPVTSEEWFARATTAIGTALAISNIAGDMATVALKEERKVALRNILISAAVVLFVLLTVIGFYIGIRKVNRNLERVSEGLAAMAGGDLTHRIKLNSSAELERRDEINIIANGINYMADKVDMLGRMKSEFLATMSHEIRTPMNGIIGMVDLLRQSNLNQEHRQMLQTINDSGQSLLTIINDILDFSKIEAGKLELESIDFSMMEVLESSAETIKMNALKKRLDLITYVDPRIPQFVIGDPVRIRQILINLGGNAIKFTEKGCVTIRADLQESENENEINIHFRVIDQGIGISDEGQQKLFKAFSQAETSTTRKYGGTGLGLSICQRLTEMMHGKIGVNSEEGKGSEFYFTISFKKSDKKIHIDKVSDLAGLNIMLVTQNEIERFVCQQYLEHWHANVITIDDISDCMNNAESCIKEGKHMDIIVLCSDWSQEQQIAMREVFKQEDKLKDIKFVLLMKGRRTKPRLDNPETVQFDVNPMRRVTFLTAISIAAGRASPEVFHEEQVEDLKAGNVALSVDDAIKQNALILVAEDNPTNRDVISRQLDILGYTCELANDGKEALEAWRTGRYFILLTDCHMPEMDGYDLTGAIREDEKNQDTERSPIVAITANALQGEAERCFAAGMDDYMSKPIDMRELRDKLVRWMPHFNPKEDSLKDFTPTKPAENVTSKENNNSEAIDPSVLMDMFGDDPVMFKEILTDFIQPSRDIIEEIKSAHQEHSAEGIKQAAHKLKSSASSVGANELADLCNLLEKAGIDENWDTIENNVPSVDTIMEEVETYINKL